MNPHRIQTQDFSTPDSPYDAARRLFRGARSNGRRMRSLKFLRGDHVPPDEC